MAYCFLANKKQGKFSFISLFVWLKCFCRQTVVPWILTTGVEWIWGLVGEFRNNIESIRPENSFVIDEANVREEDLKMLLQLTIFWVSIIFYFIT